MNPKRLQGLLALVCLGLAASAWAQRAPRLAAGNHARAEADAALAAIRRERDPTAPVYIVTSRDTYPLMKDVAVDAAPAFDSIGTALVVSRIQARDLGTVSARIHTKQLRCGGFFAFASRAEADAFVRKDRAAQIVRKAALATYTIDNQATVDPWLPQSSASNIYSTISTLSSYQNRYYTSTTGKTSAEWIRTTWQGLAGSRTDVTSELFTGCTNCSTQPSVILTIQGNELPNEVVVLGAHLDSINVSGGGSTTQVAPGADDDASGIATLTEVLRVALASGWKPKRTVKFMGYAAEEVGLRGSNAIAQSYLAAGTNVYAVLQLDMTNYKPSSGSDMRLVTDYSNTGVQNFLTSLFDTYLAPLGLTRGTYTCGYGCSDHASWTSAGYPAAIMFEGGTSSYFSNIHTANDTLANMGNSAANSAKFAKLGLAFLGEAAKTSGGGGGGSNTAPVANFSFTTSGLTATFTDTSTDAQNNITSRSWNFGDGTTSTATNPTRTYAAAGTYTVTETVTDAGGLSSTKTASVTVSSTSCGGTVLCSGTAVALPSVATGAWSSIYTIAVPAGKTSVVFNLSGGTGDADLYVRIGSAPTTTAYNCRPYLSGNTETCTFNAPTAGTYYVGVRAYSAYSGVSLKATISP
ncbi:MAG: M20/M25/M40 family metallo-hydrolase [Xanthomonadales bacterium]|nr:M20/M25/M40 family metallo-hydrolase [Xanthomonadales bacterium]